jgi:GNAT superfamily N-acetyltransferase
MGTTQNPLSFRLLEHTTQAVDTRIATPADAECLVVFINHVFARDNYFKTTQRTDLQQMKLYLEKGNFLLHEVSGRLIGCVYSELREGNRAYLGILAVDPNIQGRGLGARLMRAGEEFCRQYGRTIIEISVINLRPELLVRYERDGFRVVGEAPYERPEILKEPCHFILLEKTLSPIEES